LPRPRKSRKPRRRAIADDINQYAHKPGGAKPLRGRHCQKILRRTQGVKYDPRGARVTICCGSTEAMMSTMMAIINPGDEIVVFEAFL